jgi:hypothetical protein
MCWYWIVLMCVGSCALGWLGACVAGANREHCEIRRRDLWWHERWQSACKRCREMDEERAEELINEM